MIASLPRWLILLLLVLIALAWRDWSQRPVIQPEGHRLSQTPRQVDLNKAEQRQLGKFSLQPQARFDLQARVLSAKRYRMGVTAELAPLDLALGWGVMSDQSIVDQIQISQGGRWYILRWDLPPPVDARNIMQSSGNMHIIPADAKVRDLAFSLRAGEFVELGGYLVNAQGPGGFRWNSSLSREDTGDGSCELFLVESIQRLEATDATADG